MPTFPSVSLILFADPGQTDQRIWQAVEALGKRQWRTEVLLIDRDPPEKASDHITYRPFPKRFKNLADAISAAKHPVIAVAERGIEIDSDQWQFMVGRIDQSPIQAAFSPIISRTVPQRWLCNLLLWLYRLFVRGFLRTEKTEFDRGLTIFTRAEIEPWLPEYQQCLVKSDSSTAGQRAGEWSSFAVTRFLALAVLHRRSVWETKIGCLATEVSATTLNNKQILVAIQRALRFWWNRIMFSRRQDELPHQRHKAIEKGIATIALMLIATFVLFRGLSFPLFEPDEARNAQLAMNIVNSGQWMALTLADENYWDKPPLQIWAIAASFKLLGVSQFATRFPVAIASMLTLLTTLLVGQRLVGFRSAWMGTLLLLLTSGFVCVGRYVTMDASLTAMATAMLLFGFLATRGSFKKHYAFAAGIACGLGILVKGPVIGALSLPPLLAIYWIAPSPQSLPRRWWMWFAAPATLIAAPWFLATTIVHPDFVTYFFWKHHVVRFSDAFNHREPFWYYLVGIFIFMFPASYLIPSVTKFMTSRKPENRLLRTREHGFLFMSAVWVIAFFSISESKLPTYIVPSFPPICLLMGVLLDRKLFSRQQFSIASPSWVAITRQPTWLEKTGRRAPVELLVWCTLTSLALLVFFKPESSSFSIMELVVSTIVLSALVAVSIAFRKKPGIAWASFGLIGLIMVSHTAHRLVPAISNARSVHLAASKLHSTQEFKNAPVVFFGRESYGASIKLEDSNITWFDETQVRSMIMFLNENPNSIIVSSEDPMDSLRRDLPWTIELEECEDARHLYVSRPNEVFVARQRSTTILR